MIISTLCAFNGLNRLNFFELPVNAVGFAFTFNICIET